MSTFLKSTHFARQGGKDGKKQKNKQMEYILKKITQLKWPKYEKNEVSKMMWARHMSKNVFIITICKIVYCVVLFSFQSFWMKFDIWKSKRRTWPFMACPSGLATIKPLYGIMIGAVFLWVSYNLYRWTPRDDLKLYYRL